MLDPSPIPAPSPSGGSHSTCSTPTAAGATATVTISDKPIDLPLMLGNSAFDLSILFYRRLYFDHKTAFWANEKNPRALDYLSLMLFHLSLQPDGSVGSDDTRSDDVFFDRIRPLQCHRPENGLVICNVMASDKYC